MTATQTTPDLFTRAAAARDTGMALVERNAGQSFTDRAKAFVLRYLSEVVSVASGEEITDACRDSGIVSHDDRAMGPVLGSLSRQKKIEKCGTTVRAKGHLTSGGNLWRLTR